MLEQKCELVISNRRKTAFVMNRGREAESARRGNDEYYEFSPLGFLGDSYFTQPPYYSNHPTENAQVALAQTFTGSASHIVEPTGYSPYYSHTPMDLDVLSTDSYQRDYAQVNSIQRGRENAPLFGITTDNRRRANSPSPTAGARARRSRKESLKGTSADEANSARQRGRPRLDTKDQTAAEVCIFQFSTRCSAQCSAHGPVTLELPAQCVNVFLN